MTAREVWPRVPCLSWTDPLPHAAPAPRSPWPMPSSSFTSSPSLCLAVPSSSPSPSFPFPPPLFLFSLYFSFSRHACLIPFPAFPPFPSSSTFTTFPSSLFPPLSHFPLFPLHDSPFPARQITRVEPHDMQICTILSLILCLFSAESHKVR